MDYVNHAPYICSCNRCLCVVEVPERGSVCGRCQSGYHLSDEEEEED